VGVRLCDARDPADCGVAACHCAAPRDAEEGVPPAERDAGDAAVEPAAERGRDAGVCACRAGWRRCGVSSCILPVVTLPRTCAPPSVRVRAAAARRPDAGPA
jgi:hypothetical protein